MQMPQDDAILLSVANTALRDEFDSVEQFCEAREWDREELFARLKAAGYRYDAAQNRFVAELSTSEC